jgi:hypothetical protein
MDLAIFYLKCTKKHPRNEFPLNILEVCAIFEYPHPTNKCPSLSSLEASFQGDKENVEPL